MTGPPLNLILLLLASSTAAYSQQIHWKTKPASELIDRALASSSLTRGKQPFHLEMTIDDRHLSAKYHATLQLDWTGQSCYRLSVHSRDFEQELRVDGASLEEDDTGDFYPSWLRSFTTALLNPVPRANDPVMRAKLVAYRGTNRAGQVFSPLSCTEK